MENIHTDVDPGTDKSNNDCTEIRSAAAKNENGLGGGDGGEEADLASQSNLDIEKSSSAFENTVQSSAEFCESSPSHDVIFTVSIVMAIQKGDEEDPSNNTGNSYTKEKKILSMGVIEAPKSQGYYHIEYSLLPDDPEPTKVDLVLFGLAAKVYMENETKVLKLWQEGEKMWLGWTQSMKVKVTRDLLLNLASHKVTFHVWDTKDRVSAKAKSDRPKAFRLPRGKRPEDPDQSGGPPDSEAAKSGGIKVMVQKLRTLCQKETSDTTTAPRMHRNSASADCENYSELKSGTAKPKQATQEATVSERPSSSTVINMDCLAASAGEHMRCNRSLIPEEERNSLLPDWKSLKLIANQEQKNVPPRPKSTQERNDLVPCHKALEPTNRPAMCPKKPSSIIDQPQFLPKRKAVKKTTQESMVFSENRKKNGIASVKLSLLQLLAGSKSVADCLASCFPGTCSIEGICCISTDRQLMSEALRMELNPLVIRILSASSLPAAPVPYHVLKEKCLPVYCQYKFHTMNVHKTGGQGHGAHVYFRDVNVILTGLLSPGELRECLGGPPLTIEVHDRDRKNAEDPPRGPASFGAEPSDEQLRSKHATLQEKSTPQNPCGIAKLDLSDLLHGQKCMKVNVPITCSPPRNSEGQHCDKWEADEPTEPPMPVGLYHDFNSVLKVWVEIACPLTQLSSTDGHSTDCPFGRIMYMFTCRNSTALASLRSEILRINAAAFQLDSSSEETIKTALSCYRIGAKDQESKDLDVVTGFHMFDGHKHLFILEGLRDKGIRRLWETIPIRLSDSEEERVEVLYNSALSFSNRLYSSLDLSLCPIHLQKQLEVIVRQPEVYLRDTFPPACLHALSRLSLLLHAKKLRNAVQSDLFPSAEMILSLNREFGILPRRREEETQVKGKKEAEAEVSPQHAVAKKLTPLDNYNIKYMEWKQQMFNQQLHGNIKDFIQGNIEEVHQASLSVKQRLKPASLSVLPMETGSCSTQISNCADLAQEPLGKEMAKERTWRLCCSQEYQQALAEAAGAEANRRASEARSRAAWRTHDGFRFPGFKSSFESNTHPRQPDEARTVELRKPWRENVLHDNILRPTLTRDTWPWVTRMQDFERYRKPAQFFGTVPPVTIHLAGESLRQEQLQYYRNVCEGNPGNREVPEFQCHVSVPAGSLGKLGDLLKDRPMKYSLRKPGMILKPVPMVAVLRPEDEEREVSPAFAPGPLTHHSLSWDSNAIPRHHSLYNKFHFTGYWRPHCFHYKRAAAPLTEEERSACRFHLPDPPPQSPARGAQRQPAGNVMETRTYGDIYLHMI